MVLPKAKTSGPFKHSQRKSIKTLGSLYKKMESVLSNQSKQEYGGVSNGECSPQNGQYKMYKISIFNLIWQNLPIKANLNMLLKRPIRFHQRTQLGAPWKKQRLDMRLYYVFKREQVSKRLNRPTRCYPWRRMTGCQPCIMHGKPSTKKKKKGEPFSLSSNSYCGYKSMFLSLNR